jgi:uncharacterized integral membrane protein
MMRYLWWALRILVFVLAFGFALKNTAPVTVRFYLDGTWDAPLALVLLVFFCAGAATGATALLGQGYRQRRELLELRKETRTRGSAPDQA